MMNIHLQENGLYEIPVIQKLISTGSFVKELMTAFALSK